jgi:hypothetical protein
VTLQRGDCVDHLESEEYRTNHWCAGTGQLRTGAATRSRRRTKRRAADLTVADLQSFNSVVTSILTRFRSS